MFVLNRGSLLIRIAVGMEADPSRLPRVPIADGRADGDAARVPLFTGLGYPGPSAYYAER